jgi:hypothetical protein
MMTRTLSAPLLAALLALLAGCGLRVDLMERRVSVSPDDRYIAVIETLDQGAMSDYYTQIYLVTWSDPYRHSKEDLIFSSRGWRDTSATWENPLLLKIVRTRDPESQVHLERVNWHDVQIRYEYTEQVPSEASQHVPMPLPMAPSKDE